MVLARMSARAKRLRTVAFTLVGVVAAYGLLAGVLAPPLAKRFAESKLQEKLGRAVAIDDVAFNPYTLKATVKGFRVLERDGAKPFAGFDVLDLDLSAASAWRLAPVIDELTLAGLRVQVIREGETSYNVDDIVERLAREAAAEEKAGKKKDPARFAVQNIRVVNSAIDFDDRPRGVKHRVDRVQLVVPFVSSLPRHLKVQVQPHFSANVNGSPLTVSGEALPFENTLRTHFNLDIRALDVPRYLGYLPAGLPVRVGAGKLDARIALRFTQAAGGQPAIDLAGTASLADVSLSTPEGALASFKRLETEISSLDPIRGVVKLAFVKLAGAASAQNDWKVGTLEAKDIAVDLPKHTVAVGSLSTSDGELALKRTAAGSLELPRIPSGSGSGSAPAGPKWQATVAKLGLSEYRFTLVDGGVKPAATHRLVLARLDADDLTTAKGFSGNAAAKVKLGSGGTVDATAAFALDPLVAKGTLDARAVDLVPMRAYVSQFSTVALKSGSASAKGSYSLQGKGESMKIGYRGGAEIANLATVDTINKEDLLNWKSVRTSGIRFEHAAGAPLELAVSEVVVDRVYSRIVVTPEGKLNVQQLRTASPAQPEGAPQEGAPAPRNIRIDRVTFVDSRLNFTDHFIKPNYTADVKELQGTVTELSSDPASRASVDLKGRWDASSPVIIAGKVNPLRGDLFVDIGAKGQDIELTKLTAYSQRYVGYGITDGKLTLDVKYHIDGGKLQGRNRILLDQLTFGEKVESPDATSLPVLFAVKLLKDANGRIDLELPISGSLEDPKFEFGALVAQVFRNLFGKAKTSPFSLIAGAGGSDAGDLAFVEFEPGFSEITPAGEKKLQALAKALQDRPGLKLEIDAHYDAARDVAALKAAALKRKLDAAPKELSKEAREKLAQEPIEIGEEELRALETRRAEQVKAYLIGGGKLPSERLILASNSAQPQAGSNANLSRVDFILR